MKLKIVQPDPDYPLAWIYLDAEYKKTDPEKLGFDLAMVLGANQITIIGPLETEAVHGMIVTVKAPVLLEDQHVKPPKRRTRSKNA